MLRTRLLTVLVALAAVAAPTASADPDDAPGAGDVQLEAARERIEALYREAAAQHAALRRFAATFCDREPGAWPEPLASEPARAAVEAFVDPTADPGIDRLRAPTLLAVEAWALWEPAVRSAARARRAADPAAAVVDVFVSAVLDVADMTPEDAWDRYLHGHDVVRAWRAANGGPEPVVEDVAELLRDLCRGPLVALVKGRFEVGPWEGWLQDLSEKQNRRQTVSVGALHVQSHEVTCASWFWFLLEKGRQDRSAVESLLPQNWTIDEEGLPVLPEGRADHPVTGVSFLQATAYAEWLGMRLPTEDEWERMATAGDAGRRYPWGAEVGRVRFTSRELGSGGTASVSECPDDATPELVLGLAGNVKELVATHPDRKPVKGTPEPEDRVVIRGGGFRTRRDECTTRWRWFVEAGAQEPDVGFRCVIDDAELKRREPR